MQRLAPFRLERYFDARELATPWLLCASDCQTRTVGELLDLEPGARDRLLDTPLGYGTARGDEELRALVASRHGDLSPDEVVVHSGGEEVILTFCLAELEPGDHVVIHSPCYQSLITLPRSLGCEVSLWSADLSRGGAIDLEALQTLLRADTKVVFVNFPHNPTGYSPSHDDWRALVDLVANSGARLFSDEAYCGSAHTPEAELPSAPALDERACALSLVSKAFGLPGLRIGWAVSRDRALLERLTQMKDYTTISANRLGEQLAAIALRHSDTILAETRQLLADNRALARRFFDSHVDRFDYHEPIAGPIGFPRLREGKVRSFVDRVFEARGVILLPGDVFEGGEQHFRVGLGRRNVAECFERLAEALSES